MAIAWGAKVSPSFRTRMIEIAKQLGTDPSWIMACMAFESGESFSPSKRNPISSATGLIQFMDKTAKALGTTTSELAQMSAIEQLEYVERYFKPYQGKLKSLSDVYMAILWPSAVGKPEAFVIFKQPNQNYTANKGLDTNKDGQVTKGEAASRVAQKLAKGLSVDLRE